VRNTSLLLETYKSENDSGNGNCLKYAKPVDAIMEGIAAPINSTGYRFYPADIWRRRLCTLRCATCRRDTPLKFREPGQVARERIQVFV
jgi:hypothetical protein